MGILSEIVEEAKVFVSTLGEYYLAVTRRDPSDSHIPSPAPALVSMLSSASKELGMSSVPVQIAQDAVHTDATSGAATEPTAQEEIIGAQTNAPNIPVVLSSNIDDLSTTILSATTPGISPEVTQPAEVTTYSAASTSISVDLNP